MNTLEKLQCFLADCSLDGIILMHPKNLRYFTGFTGTTGVAFISATEALMITDGRYTEQAKQQCVDYRVIEYKDSPFTIIQEVFNGQSLKIGFEGNHVIYDTFERMKKIFPSVLWQSISLESLRAGKSQEELTYLREAAAIADKAFAATLSQIKVGMTENQFRIILETEMLRAGSEERSFETIVASGKRSSMPHGVASDKIVESGDFVTFDFGAMYKGYHSDITRTIVMGDSSERQRELYQLVLRAQQNACSAVQAGVKCADIDKVARDIIEEAGYGKYFSHGLGHGVGLDIHESPILSYRSKEVLTENMVVTVEPGIYLPDDIGLRIEDSGIVTSKGFEIITLTTKELIEIK